MNRKFRIAVGQLSSESNHFVPARCDLDFIRSTGYLHEGEALLELAGSDSEVGGILAACKEAADVEVVPLAAMRCNSSSVLTAPTYDYLKRQILDRCNNIDGVILSCHGSMSAEGVDDPDGDLAQAIRQLCPAVPIALTLDLHGNVTRQMVESTDVIVGYEHYPHDDTFTTGRRGADLLLRTIRGEIRPVMALAKLPMLLTAYYGSTQGDGPFARLMRQAKKLESRLGVLSTSIFFVGSYIDVPEMGCSTLVITDGNRELAEMLTRELAADYWAGRREFDVQMLSVEETVRRGRAIEGGPVLLLDTADTTGGGAAGDSIGLVREWLRIKVTEPCLAMVVDSAAASACCRAGVGNTVTVRIGHAVDPNWGRPIEVTGVVRQVSDGRFQYKGGILAGRDVTMGPSAVLAVGSVQILVMTYPTYDWGDEQYRAVGVNPREFKFIGVKNMMNFRIAYGNIMRAHYVLDLPGPTSMDMRAMPFKRVRRPIYPLDEFRSEPEPQVICHG